MKYEARELKETADLSRGETTWADKLKFAFTVVVVLGGGYFGLGVVADLVAANIPDRYESRWFSGTLIDANDNDKRLDRAREIFDRLLKDREIRPLDYKLFMLDLGVPNAIAVPGGGVGITPELLEIVKSDAGLAMVLGHELGHHRHRHALKAMGRVILRASATALLFGSQDQIISTANTIVQRQHSRSAEREADEFGMRLLHRTMDNTEGAFEFFQWAESQEGAASRMGMWMRTHPLSEERIDRLHKLSREIEESK